jgi:hypothetical protein
MNSGGYHDRPVSLGEQIRQLRDSMFGPVGSVHDTDLNILGKRTEAGSQEQPQEKRRHEQH